jgi:hypothetical protein
VGFEISSKPTTDKAERCMDANNDAELNWKKKTKKMQRNERTHHRNSLFQLEPFVFPFGS